AGRGAVSRDRRRRRGAATAAGAARAARARWATRDPDRLVAAANPEGLRGDAGGSRGLRRGSVPLRAARRRALTFAQHPPGQTAFAHGVSLGGGVPPTPDRAARHPARPADRLAPRHG